MSDKSMIAKQLGDRIRAIRTEKGLTQEKLGHLAELHPSHMGQIERGERSASVETLEKLVKALDITFRELFEFADMGRRYESDSVLLEICCELQSKSASDQKFALDMIKSMFEWKKG